MVIRQFDPSARSSDEIACAALSRYEDFVKDPSRYPGVRTAAEIALPVEYEVAWQLLLETQHLGHWLDGDYRASDSPLPIKFRIGEHINSEGSLVLHCEQERYTKKSKLILQRRFYSDGAPVYYTFELSPYERFTTKISAVAEYRHDRLGGVATFVRSVFNVDDEKHFSITRLEISEGLRKALKRFANFCWDRSEFGPASDHYPGRWFTWYYEPDRLYFYKNRNGHDGPELGELIRSGERIGFLYPTGTSEPLDQWKSSHYIEPADGYVKKILKKHGDHVEHGDRILLTAPDPDADFSQASLQVKFLIEAVGGSRSGGFQLAKYNVEIGQRIKQGDVLATLVDEYKPTTPLFLRSPYCGTVSERGIDVGTKLFCKEYDTLLRVRCDRAFV